MKQVFRDIPIIIFVALGILFGSYLLTVYWLTWPYKTVEMITPYAPDQPVIAGASMRYQFNMRKYTTAPARVNRQIFNGHSIMFPVTSSNLPAGVNKGFSYLDIPDYIPSGQYRLITTYEYDVNPIRTIKKVCTSEPFTIINKKEEEYKAKDKKYKAQQNKVEKNSKDIKEMNKKIDTSDKNKKPTFSIFSK
jgi:hypothetical protein